MHNFFNGLRLNPRSLFGKVQLRLVPTMVVLLLSALAAHLHPENAVSGLGAGVVIGLFVAGFAPFWMQRPQQPEARPGYLYPRIALQPQVEFWLLCACAASLSAGYALFDTHEEIAVALQVMGAACGAVVVSPRLPVWRLWPVR